MIQARPKQKTSQNYTNNGLKLNKTRRLFSPDSSLSEDSIVFWSNFSPVFKPLSFVRQKCLKERLDEATSQRLKCVSVEL